MKGLTLPLGMKIENHVESSPVVDGKIRVRSSLAERCIKEGLDLVVLNRDDITKCVRLDGLNLAEDVKATTSHTYQNETEGSYTIFQYAYKEEESNNYLTSMDLAMIKQFHPSWFNKLRRYLNTPEFKELLKKIKTERETKTVYPSGPNVFRVFRETNLDQVKAVIVGQDPYAYPAACGIPFAVEKGVKKPASLLFIEKAFGVTIEDTMLSTVIKQGVLFLNSSWTVQESLPASHSLLWEPFTAEVMQAVGQLNKPKVFILMGKKAQDFEQCIAKWHIVEKIEHPAKAAREKRDWNHKHMVTLLNRLYRDEFNTTLQW